MYLVAGAGEGIAVSAILVFWFGYFPHKFVQILSIFVARTKISRININEHKYIYYKINNKDKIYQVLQTENFGNKSYILLNSSVNIKVRNEELYMLMVKYDKFCSINTVMNHTVQIIQSFLRFLQDKEDFNSHIFITFFLNNYNYI